MQLFSATYEGDRRIDLKSLILYGRRSCLLTLVFTCLPSCFSRKVRRSLPRTALWLERPNLAACEMPGSSVYKSWSSTWSMVPSATSLRHASIVFSRAMALGTSFALPHRPPPHPAGAGLLAPMVWCLPQARESGACPRSSCALPEIPASGRARVSYSRSHEIRRLHRYRRQLLWRRNSVPEMSSP